MKHIPLTTLCVAISAVLLTACGGSGGSNPPAPMPIPNAGGAGNAGSGTGGAGSTDNAANAGSTGGASSGTGSASTSEPKYQDVLTEKNEKAEVSGIQEPAMGYGMALSKINLYEQKDISLDANNIITLDGKKDNQKSPLPFSLDVENKLLDGYMAKMNEADKNAIGERIKRDNRDNKANPLSEAELAKKIKEDVRKSPDFQQVLSSMKAKTFHSNDGTTKATTRDLKYVDYGYYLVNDANYLTVKKTDEPKLWNSGPVGGVFYNGTTTAKELPTQDEVKYKGHWDFMTDVAKKRNRFSEVKETYQAGWWYGASSKDEYNRLLTQENAAPEGHSGEYGHSSEFTVNFKDKKLTGELFSNLQDSHKQAVNKTKRYNINASIHGNRFRGSATASNKDDTSKHPFTSDANDKLEGGFYGPKGEELAGKFLTDDNKLFGVFGAKQEGNVEKTEAILDAYALGTFNENDANTFTPFTEKQLDNFGNAKKLVLGSTVIDLVSTDATKNEFTKDKPESATNKAGETLMVNDTVSVKTYGKNFEYLKFGELSVGDSHSVFLQGERTAEKAVPTTDKAKYLGNWVGYITGKDSSKGFNDAEDVANFDIDFGSKTVNGKLITKGRKDPVFNITGEIAGNGWKGTASTAEANAGGYKIDSSSTGKSIVIKDAKVTGGFYGPNATEMGGSFVHKNSSDDGKVSVVFGTKKQQEVK
ncbi:transferrin-binding protein-like solute binding protein [Moraxella catarrhalis]|uniref:transferrin-binding protein-like solute binding protein n=1 Tax=Moraxella catarrhalis TaxID=480 RepID=UPI000EA89085|nr:transferrin-binding protein-like solute binding protein [Moraxella catarrhalis]MPX28600.1 transferrin-binding protein [Moraxella catarrhalis]RKL86412.1 transferrin-binding protein-like solute binding protein [Moraxella catarrhalis]RKL87197.1 transferrin-binding protein-like solute binding protein [Moraxella catarrhalis]RKL97352.1 transferrin-binding protein-like solute binding protein [Moraxella catarrhalis]